MMGWTLLQSGISRVHRPAGARPSLDSCAVDHFTRGSLVFPVLDSGPRAGEPVVLLHGFPQTASSYDGVAARLNVAGFRTVIPTQRGYAGTARPRPVQRRLPDGIAELVGDVVALIDALGVERVHLVGPTTGPAVGPGRSPACNLTGSSSLTVLSTPHPAALRESAAAQFSKRANPGYMPVFSCFHCLARTNRCGSHSTWYSRGGLGRRTGRRATPGPWPTDNTLTGALNWYRGLPFSLGTKNLKIVVPTT